MNRKEMADLILEKIRQGESTIRERYENSRADIGYFVIDDILPAQLALQLHEAFPGPESMKMRKSLREYKYFAVQMNQYDPVLEEAIYAFQDARIVDLIRKVCSIESLYPDEHLYAGGLSLMRQGQFLNPHLDNSHEGDRKRWRVLNLLYYVSPRWKHQYGGNLEIWSHGVKQEQITIDSLFNRLVVMATHGTSWHSVSPVCVDSSRTCISNYYYSDTPLKPQDSFHVTSFRGRPEQKFRDLVLQADIALRQGVRKILPGGAVNTGHVYRKPDGR